MLQALRPQSVWARWMLQPHPAAFWQIPARQKEALDWVFQEMQMRDMSHWYLLRTADLKAMRLGPLLKLFSNSLPYALQSTYPQYPFHISLDSTAWHVAAVNSLTFFVSGLIGNHGVFGTRDQHQVAYLIVKHPIFIRGSDSAPGKGSNIFDRSCSRNMTSMIHRLSGGIQ
jgi:hypothetical protein